MDWRRLALVVALALAAWWAWGRWGPATPPDTPTTTPPEGTVVQDPIEPGPADPDPGPVVAEWDTFITVDWDGPVEGLLDDLAGKTAFEIRWDRGDPEIQAVFAKTMSLTGEMTAGNVLSIVSQATGLGLRLETDEDGLVHRASFTLDEGIEVVPTS